MLDLRVAPGSAAFSAVTQVLGFEPGGRGEAKEQAAANALCLAPDWWLLLGCEGLVPALTALKARHHISVVDVSDQRTVIDLSGPNAREVLAHLWEQDLREKSFPAGSVSQGMMVKAPVILWHVRASNYRILVRSSFAIHVWKALTDAAEEYITKSLM